MLRLFQVGLEDYDGCEIPLERMDDFEPEETYIIPNPVLPDTQEDEQGEPCAFFNHDQFNILGCETYMEAVFLLAFWSTLKIEMGMRLPGERGDGQ